MRWSGERETVPHLSDALGTIWAWFPRWSLLAVLTAVACTSSPQVKGKAAADAQSHLSAGASQENTESLIVRRACALPTGLLRRLQRGYYAGRSPEIVTVPAAPNFYGSFSRTTHAGPWDYLQRVPLVLYGPGFIRAQGPLSTTRPVTLADLAPTLAELLDTSWSHARPGRSLREALVPATHQRTPRLIVVVVWDGGGWNVLNRWPEMWPTLRRLAAQGTTIRDVRVGSSPSVTPAIHATIGTGSYPDTHGIVDIYTRAGDEVVGSWPGRSPADLELTTLADLYDLRTENEAKIAMIAERRWHLGMIGHGAAIHGGDKDVAVMGSIPGAFFTNPRYYSLPQYLQKVSGFEKDVYRIDIADGQLDSMWLGHELEPVGRARETPVMALYQSRLIDSLIERGGYGFDGVTDLIYANFKQIDLAGHAWNMVNREVGDTIRYSDGALAHLVAMLNRHVGRKRWVIALTADHGQTPSAESVGAWPINVNELSRDVAQYFHVEASELFQMHRPGSMWFYPDALTTHNISLEQIARYLIEYRMRDNIGPEVDPPSGYASRMHQRLFESAFPYAWMARIWDCSKNRSHPGSSARPAGLHP